MTKKPLLINPFLWLTIGLCLNACCQPTVEYPPIEQLMIDETAFPEGWEASEIDTEFGDLAPFSSGRDEIATAHRFISLRSMPNIFATIRIDRYRSPNVAARDYGYIRDDVFSEKEWRTACHVPAELTFTSSYADQYGCVCCTTGKAVSCYYVARYGAHVLEFRLNDASVITYQDLAVVFEAIEERMEPVVDGG